MTKATDNRPYFSPFVATIDLLLVIGSGYLAHSLRFSTIQAVDLIFQVIMAGTGLMLVLSATSLGVYNSWRGRRLFSLIRRYTLAVAWTATVLTAFLVFTKSAHMVSRLWLGMFFLIFWFGGCLYRAAHYYLMRFRRKYGLNVRRVLLITSPYDSEENLFGKDLREFGFEIAATINSSQLDESLRESALEKEIELHGIQEVWVNLPLNMGSLLKDIIYELRHETVDIRFVPDFADIQLLNHKASNIAGIYTIDISCTPMDGFNRIVKRAEDLILASIIGIAILPICLFIALLIRLDSPGPIIFRQFRNGLDGRKITVYKFRSMEVHNEADGGVTQAQPGDPRITKLGYFLRRTSLDELPQFFNVLQGRMSIVGPRPHALVHNEFYKDLVESYMWRHKVKPGITGLAQIRGLRGLTDTVEKMEARVECDLEYINNWSIWLDIRIILITAYKGFISPNAQ